MEIQDQLFRTLHFKTSPKRIVSLVPSQTELLADLGLEDYIFGVTKFCVHPIHLRKTKQIVGGTKKVNFQKIKDLEPDIILCNKEENTKEMVLELERIAPVHISNIFTLQDAYELMLQYGDLFECRPLAETLVVAIQKKVKSLKAQLKDIPVKKVAYFIWKKPLMLAGQETFINELLKLNKFENATSKKRYPVIEKEALIKINLDFIFLSSEPYPFKEKHISDFKAYCKKVEIVDGEYFSWYGSRLLKAMDYFKTLQD